ncbi:hypothetical protein EDD18DRAFT_1211256 [Armillaria luteobubalina]|uniref:Uncharacterized protein n=1 Tax=Armillaria luteobubalina TaxID=153913 RepID=A0AA39TB35_9AGAR|nr:hypothetical protein EDD18DRAFT_1211256 [Armillaria luteobubalina]
MADLAVCATNSSWSKKVSWHLCSIVCSTMPSRRNRKQSGVPSITPMDIILAQQHIMLAQFYLGIGTLNGGVQNVPSTRPPTPIEAFFARYPEYPYDQSRETMSQFWEMSSQFGWGKNVERESLGDLRDAIAQQFNDIYGADVNDLQAWQRLCGLVGDGNIPDNIAACRAVIRRVHVNMHIFHPTHDRGIGPYDGRTSGSG